MEEYRNVPLELESKGKITRLQLEALISGIASFVANAKMVFPRRRLSLCRDDKDNMVLECCLESKAGFLVTGDNDLLVMDNLPFNLEVLSPRDYIESMGYK